MKKILTIISVLCVVYSTSAQVFNHGDNVYTQDMTAGTGTSSAAGAYGGGIESYGNNQLNADPSTFNATEGSYHIVTIASPQPYGVAPTWFSILSGTVGAPTKLKPDGVNLSSGRVRIRAKASVNGATINFFLGYNTAGGSFPLTSTANRDGSGQSVIFQATLTTSYADYIFRFDTSAGFNAWSKKDSVNAVGLSTNEPNATYDIRIVEYGFNPPTTAITAPNNNSSYAPGATINFTATATPYSVATIDSVEFYDGANYLGVDKNGAPYTYSNAGTLSTGSHTITSKAYQSDGQSKVSSGISIGIGAPTITLTAPTNNTVITSTGALSVDLLGTPSGTNTIDSLILVYDDGINGKDTLSGPLGLAHLVTTVPGGTFPLGTYTMYAVAFQTGGIPSAPSSTIKVYVGKPTVALTAPAANATFTTGTSVTFTATATADGTGATIDSVVYYAGTTRLGKSVAGPTYSFSTSSLAAGNYNITAKVYQHKVNGAPQVSSITAISVTAPSTGVMDATSNSLLSVYPNPVKDQLTVDMTSLNLAGTAIIKFMNANGSVLSEETTANTTYTLNTSGMNKGVYLLQVIIADKVANKRVVIE